MINNDKSSLKGAKNNLCNRHANMITFICTLSNLYRNNGREITLQIVGTHDLKKKKMQLDISKEMLFENLHKYTILR